MEIGIPLPCMRILRIAKLKSAENAYVFMLQYIVPLGLYDRASRRLLMNETNSGTVNFQFLLMAQQLYMFQGSFSAHHQQHYQPYDGFGTISC